MNNIYKIKTENKDLTEKTFIDLAKVICDEKPDIETIMCIYQGKEEGYILYEYEPKTSIIRTYDRTFTYIDEKKIQPIKLNDEIDYQNPEIKKLQLVTKDEYVLYLTTGFWKGQTKEYALESFDRIANGHEFIFMLPLKRGTSSYSVEFIDDMLRR